MQDFTDSGMVKPGLQGVVDNQRPLARLRIVSHVGLLCKCYMLHGCHKGNTNPYGNRAALPLPPGDMSLDGPCLFPGYAAAPPAASSFGINQVDTLGFSTHAVVTPEPMDRHL